VKKLRKQRAQVFEMFKAYASQYIQAWWRGYKTRREVLPQLELRKTAKQKIRALGVGWKTRKILKTKPLQDIRLQIVDM
jgi:hypothetical protein